MDLDDTQELLDSTVPSSVDLDSSEDEIFFGQETIKEKEKKPKRRETLLMPAVESSQGGRKTSREKLLDNESLHCGRTSLYLKENSISEEEEELEVGEITSTMDQMRVSCENDVGCISDDPNSASKQQELCEEEICDKSCDDIVQCNEWSEVSSGVEVNSNISGITPLDSCSGIYDSFSDDTSREIMTEEDSAIVEDDEETDKVGEDEQSLILGNGSVASQLRSRETLQNIQKLKSTSTEHKYNDECPDIIISRPSVGVADQSHVSGVYKTAPSSPAYHHPEHHDDDEQIDFDTSAEEILLYEMFGEDYDEIVEQMTVQEKKELKEILDEKGEDEIVTIKSKLMNQLGEKRASILRLSVGSPFPFHSASPATRTRSRSRTRSSYIHDDPDCDPVAATMTYRDQEDKDETSMSEDQFHSIRSPASSPLGLYKENFTRPTSPNTMTRSKQPWMPPSPRPKETESHNRLVASSSPLKPLSRVGSSSRIPQISTPSSRLPQPVYTPTPKSGRVLRNHPLPVESPVAKYVKNNPVPRLVQNVVAKECSNELESTLVEVENIPNLQDTCPLPFAVYTPTEHREQTTVNLSGKEYSYIPEAYGEVTTSAVVTRHLGRRKMEKLKEEEVDHSFSYRSPRQDDDILETEMSVVETKIIKRVGMKTPRRM